MRSAKRWRMEKVTVTTTARMKTGAESLEAIGKSSLSQGEDWIGLVGRDYTRYWIGKFSWQWQENNI